MDLAIRPEDAYQDVAFEEREETLKQTADEIIEDAPYERPLTEEEQDGHQGRLVEIHLQMHEKEETFREIRKLHNEEMNPLKRENKALLGELSKGTKAEKGTLYGEKDYDNRVMNYFNGEGKFVRSRALRQKEMNTSIQSDLRLHKTKV